MATIINEVREWAADWLPEFAGVGSTAAILVIITYLFLWFLMAKAKKSGWIMSSSELGGAALIFNPASFFG